MSNIAQDAPPMRDAMACSGYQRRRKALKRVAVAVIVTISRTFGPVSRPIGWCRPYHRCTILSAAITLLCAAAWTPGEAAQLSIYEIKTETDMPNLKENLRYADTRVRRCMSGNTVSDFFPILQYESLDGCTLEVGDRLGDTVYYPLVCHGSSGTTGVVLLYTHADRVEGLLEVKVGGKNMRFSQRIDATRQGDCQSLQ